MVKRYNIVLISICLVVFYIISSEVVMAADRWTLIRETNSDYWYYDSYSIKQYGKPDDKFLNVWVMSVNKDESSGNRTIAHEFIRKNTGSYLEDEVKVYRSNGKLYTSYSNKDKGWRIPVPGSDWEAVVWAIINQSSS